MHTVLTNQFADILCLNENKQKDMKYLRIITPFTLTFN